MALAFSIVSDFEFQGETTPEIAVESLETLLGELKSVYQAKMDVDSLALIIGSLMSIAWRKGSLTKMLQMMVILAEFTHVEDASKMLIPVSLSVAQCATHCSPVTDELVRMGDASGVEERCADAARCVWKSREHDESKVILS